jgi:hypothetical protein
MDDLFRYFQEIINYYSNRKIVMVPVLAKLKTQFIYLSVNLTSFSMHIILKDSTSDQLDVK